MKKLFSTLSLFALIVGLVGCQEQVVITIGTDLQNGITLTEEDVISLEDYTITHNDDSGIVYQSENESIFTVSETGTITGVGEGTATLSIVSASDENVSIDVTITVRKKIDLLVSDSSVTLTEDDTHQLVVTSNDGVLFASSDLNIAVVDEDGLITAKEEGTTTITVTSSYDNTVTKTVEVIVEKRVELSLVDDSYVLIVGDTTEVEYTTNDEVTIESRDPNVITVSETGIITAVGFGVGTVRITSNTNTDVFVDVTVTVFKYTEEITIEGSTLIVVGMTTELTIDPSPVGAFEGVTWQSLDQGIITIDQDGMVTGVSVGTGTVQATSSLDDTIIDTFQIEVINVVVVKEDATTGDTYEYNGVTLSYGEKLFDTITDALTNATPGTLIYIDSGTFDEAVIINVDDVHLQGTELVTITGSIDVQADGVTIENMSFEGNSTVSNSVAITDFSFVGNTVEPTTLTTGAFLSIDGINGITISNNTFQNIGANAIVINDFTNGAILIEDNTIYNVQAAITITAESMYDITSEINIWWNDIDTVDTAFDINMLYGTEQQTIEAIVRFNTVTNATMNAVSNVDNTIDFTLNYWGTSTVEPTQFTNIEDYYLRGYYILEEDVPTETEYNPDYPIYIIIENPIEEITIGESHTFTYSILPMELSDHPIKFITGAPDLVHINQDGVITPLSSGEAYIQVRSAINSSIRTQDDFTVVTTPGIELTPSNVYNNILVGDSFTLTAQPFPVSISDAAVAFASSNEAIATIDGQGVVSTHSAGVVVITANLVDDPSVTQTFTFEVFDQLDATNLLDYLTMNQINYTTSHEFTVYGFQYNFGDRRYESVSRYYFGDLVINDSKIVPVSYGIRPGEPMDPLPTGVTQYNPDNVHWIVVHDTASTATGSGALAHANYLYNGATNGTQLWVSWHFTIDSEELYQHLPTNERGYHAGDGSTNPGEGTYTGGGNRNGIGLEMAVNDDGDMYRTWQRTAKLVVQLLQEYNLPLDHMKYHNDFSGKDCPNTLRNAGLIPLFEKFAETEYTVATEFSGATITFASNNPDYVDDNGVVIQFPERAMTISYTITVTYDGITESRTFYSYLPGTVR